MQRVRWVILVAIVTMVSAAAMPRLTGAAPPQPPDKSPPVGKPAPAIEGKDVNGNPIALSDFKGKLVMLDFFGDW